MVPELIEGVWLGPADVAVFAGFSRPSGSQVSSTEPDWLRRTEAALCLLPGSGS